MLTNQSERIDWRVSSLVLSRSITVVQVKFEEVMFCTGSAYAASTHALIAHALPSSCRCCPCCSCCRCCCSCCSAGLCYFGVSILGFWAFGTGVGDNVLLAFKEGPNHWVVTMATMLVVVHVAAAFQVSSL